MSSELEAAVEEESRAQWNQKHEDLVNDTKPLDDNANDEIIDDVIIDEDEDENIPLIDIDDEE